MNNETDFKVYLSLLHKCINDTLAQISDINIEKLNGNQDEYRRIVSWIHFDHYEAFVKSVETIFGDNKEELADLMKDLTNSTDVKA